MPSPRDRPGTDGIREMPGITGASIRIARDPDGRPLWEIGSEQAPTTIATEIEGGDWNGYLFQLTYDASAGLTGFSVVRDDNAKPLTARKMQTIPLGALDRFAQQWFREWIELWDESNPPTKAAALFPDPLDWLDKVVDPDAGSESDIRLARLCKRYLELVKEPKNPMWRRILAYEFDLKESGVQTKISRARRRRFLTPVAHGQSGGQLTPKAHQLLAPPERRSAWDLASPAQRQAALDCDALRQRIKNDLDIAYRSGQSDSTEHRARLLAATALILGHEPEQMYPNESVPAIREAVRYLQSTYEELAP